MTTTQTIPLKSLTLWTHNVRKTNAAEGIEELAASIKASGLIQSLAVIAHGKTFAVVAGGRRLAALQHLCEQGHINGDYPVNCNVLENERALEASLAENAMRVAMHPADQFEAFRALVDQGLSLSDVAARFGVAERIVEQRLKLARVAPSIVKAYRNGDTDLECIMAFAVVDDAKAQVRLWKSLAAHQRKNASRIRSALTEGEIDASDRRVRFVTLEAYEAADGATRCDLFTEGEDGIFILQPDLLCALVDAKLEDIRKDVALEGWSWTEVRDDFDYAERAKFRAIHAEPQELREGLQQELDGLEQERERIYESDDDDAGERLQQIDERIDAIEEQRPYAWPDGTMEHAGAIVTLTYDGRPEIVRGLTQERLQQDRAVRPRDPGALPKSLTRYLRAQRSAALSAELTRQPALALAAIAHTLACSVFLLEDGGNRCLRISADTSMPADETSRASQMLLEAHAAWIKRLPAESDALWQWCLAQEQDVLLSLLAFCTALSVNAVVYDDTFLGTALQLDMRQWFTPSASNYFSSISKAQIIEALTEAKGALAPAWHKARKSELAATGGSWLPSCGCSPTPCRLKRGRRCSSGFGPSSGRCQVSTRQHSPRRCRCQGAVGTPGSWTSMAAT